MSGSTPILGITEVAASQNQKEVTINDGFVAIENATQAEFAVNFTANTGTVTLAQFQSAMHFKVPGTLTGIGTLIVPNSPRDFQVFNGDTIYPILVGGTSGSQATIAASSLVQIYNDGTNCFSVDAPAATGSAITAVVGTSGVSVNTTLGVATASLSPIAAGDLLANATGSSAAPVPTSLSALIDDVIGSNQGAIIIRGSSTWEELTIGSAGQALVAGASLPGWVSAIPASDTSHLLGASGTAGVADAVTIAGNQLTLTSGTLGIATGPTIAVVETTDPLLVNGGTSVPQAAPTGTLFQLTGPTGASAVATCDGYGAGGWFIGRRAQGTALAPTAVQNTNVIIRFAAYGYNGSAYVGPTADCYMAPIENWTTAANGTGIFWRVTAPGTTILAQAMELAGSGHLLIGTSTDATSDLLQVNGGINANGTLTGTALNVPVGAGLVLNSGVPAVEPSQLIRTIPFSIIGTPAGGQQMNVTLTQAGTLIANGGTPQAYIGTNPTATEHLVLSTIHSGSVTTQGTISINTGGTVTWPTFSGVSMAAGDTVQLQNQATADATFANACLSLQYEVT